MKGLVRFFEGLVFVSLLAGVGAKAAHRPVPQRPEKLDRETQTQIEDYLTQASEKMSRLKMNDALLRELFSYEDAKHNRISLVAPPQTSQELPKEWALLDPEKDGVEGTSTERAYRELDLLPPVRPVIVAIIDSGVDIHHEDLKDHVWINNGELEGTPGKDNDGNGYANDLNGWNFLGNKNGKNLTSSNLEVTRELARIAKKQASSGLTPDEAKYMAALQNDYDSQVANINSKIDKMQTSLNELETAIEVLKKAGLKDETIEAVQAIQSKDPAVLKAKDVAVAYLSNSLTTARLKDVISSLREQLDTYFNKDFDPSSVIGDDPNKMDEIGYGNTDVVTETAMHGTHVAGIIGAVRNNGKGMNGQDAFVSLMPVRAVPDGDERDKDVAHAVRYAVDNGARIISMSFGKPYSPRKDVVDEAFKYAEEKGVLVIHAAGNDSRNTDDATFFPNRWVSDSKTGEKRELSNWIEVGASAALKDQKLAARFSNFGKKSVHLFAPGNEIYSTLPNNQYGVLSGTSMAAPEVSGIAALILSQAPFLRPSEVKELILNSVRKYPGLQVFTPNRDGSETLVDFERLSITGGIIDARAALMRMLRR